MTGGILMRFLKYSIITIFCICLAAFICHYEGWFEVKDVKGPVITCDADLIEVSVSASEEEFLAGMTAVDDVDGDVTDSLMVSGMSLVNAEEHTRAITYAVFDSSNNVSTYTRTVKYTDYEPPIFSLSRQLVFNEGDKVSVLNYVNAYDLLDGDISQNVKIISGDNTYEAVGHYPVVLGVSNSCGDYSELELTVTIQSYDRLAVSNTPEIALTNYLEYINVGEAFDPTSYIKNVYSKVEGEVIGIDSVGIKSGVDIAVPGKYTVTYSVMNTLGYTGESSLIVIVRE